MPLSAALSDTQRRLAGILATSAPCPLATTTSADYFWLGVALTGLPSLTAGRKRDEVEIYTSALKPRLAARLEWSIDPARAHESSATDEMALGQWSLYQAAALADPGAVLGPLTEEQELAILAGAIAARLMVRWHSQGEEPRLQFSPGGDMAEWLTTLWGKWVSNPERHNGWKKASGGRQAAPGSRRTTFDVTGWGPVGALERLFEYVTDVDVELGFVREALCKPLVDVRADPDAVRKRQQKQASLIPPSLGTLPLASGHEERLRSQFDAISARLAMVPQVVTQKRGYRRWAQYVVLLQVLYEAGQALDGQALLGYMDRTSPGVLGNVSAGKPAHDTSLRRVLQKLEEGGLVQKDKGGRALLTEEGRSIASGRARRAQPAPEGASVTDGAPVPWWSADARGVVMVPIEILSEDPAAPGVPFDLSREHDRLMVQYLAYLRSIGAARTLWACDQASSGGVTWACETLVKQVGPYHSRKARPDMILLDAAAGAFVYIESFISHGATTIDRRDIVEDAIGRQLMQLNNMQYVEMVTLWADSDSEESRLNTLAPGSVSWIPERADLPEHLAHREPPPSSPRAFETAMMGLRAKKAKKAKEAAALEAKMARRAAEGAVQEAQGATSSSPRSAVAAASPSRPVM